ncbi:MAG: porin, partial [Ferruginibacter sp.]
MLRKTLVLISLLILSISVPAQFLMDMVDTTKDMGKSMLGIYKKFDHIRISGYMQPQFQAAQAKGLKNFSGG